MVRYTGTSSSSTSSTAASESSPSIASLRPLMEPNGHDKDLFATLQALHADEFTYLSKRLKGHEHEWEESWWRRCFDMSKQYVSFILTTWTKCAWALLFYPLTLMDRISVVVLSMAACMIMTVLFPWCLLCSFSFVGGLADWASKRMFNGLSIANAAYPKIFEELSPEQVSAARRYLSKPLKEASLNTTGHTRTRVFNLDSAKLLLQCAALMYERSSVATRKAAAIVASHTSPTASQNTDNITPDDAGSRIKDMCGCSGAEAIIAQLHSNSGEEDTIRGIAAKDLGLQYSAVSELNSIGSSFCALFWDPTDTFIIVSFKGTSPTDFMEWCTDFTFQMRDANQWLNGFGKVHDGFMEKVFPRKISHGSLIPYDTIVEAIKRVATNLVHARGGGTQINVWITGHSLGCALASVVYSRLINESHELGDDVVIRDAYLFAAPIVCDVTSAGAFNNRMNHYGKEPRTMWRVTNGLDAVATCLPDAGDDTRWSLSPWNLFAFSHLGSELQMRSAPNKCEISGGHITPGIPVVIESAFHLDALNHHETPLRETLKWLQNLPILGRLVAHAPGFYWSTLLDVGTGACKWKED